MSSWSLFYFFRGVARFLVNWCKESANHSLWVNSSSQPVCKKRFIGAQPCPFTTVYGCFWTVKAESSSCNRSHLAWKASNVYFLALYRTQYADFWTAVLYQSIWQFSIVIPIDKIGKYRLDNVYELKQVEWSFPIAKGHFRRNDPVGY